MASIDSNRHFLPCPWPINPDAQRAGGVDTVVGSEIRRAVAENIDLTVFSIDKQPWSAGRVKILPAAEGDFPPEYFKALFGAGYWPVLHAHAFTSVAAEHDVLAAMFEANQSAFDLGSLDRLIEFSNRIFPTLGDPDIVFNARYDALFAGISNPQAANPGRAHVHFQDFFTAPSALKHADRLREAGAFISFHHHESIRPGLAASHAGQRLLSAMAKCDVVFVHTDQFVRQLMIEMNEALSRSVIANIPPIRRFDLGISHSGWDRMIGKVDASNFESTIPDFASLSQRHQTIAAEIFKSQNSVPHRFACFDRLDPNKGTNTIVDAIRLFLEEELRKGNSLADLRAKYRFFGIHDAIGLPPSEVADPTDPSRQYNKVVQAKWNALEKDFSGIAFYSEPFSGAQRIALPALFQGCHCLAGGADDGLGLATMENAYVNSKLMLDTSLVVGDGAGFAIQTKENGDGHLGYFPSAGNAKAFVDAFRAITKSVETSPGQLREKTAQLVKRQILPRNATMLVTPADI